MAAGRNKVLLELAGRPLLAYSLDIFRACCTRVVVVSAEADLHDVRRLDPDVAVVPGGTTRHGSEWKGLQAVRDDVRPDDVIALHDAARPLVALSDVGAVFAAAEAFGAAMLAVPCQVPALESVAGRVVRAYQAAELWRAQTPQAARARWLLDAYERAARRGFDGTDTAAVLAAAGYPCRVVAATGDNPKVTVPADLALAEALLTRRQ